MSKPEIEIRRSMTAIRLKLIVRCRLQEVLGRTVHHFGYGRDQFGDEVRPGSNAVESTIVGVLVRLRRGWASIRIQWTSRKIEQPRFDRRQRKQLHGSIKFFQQFVIETYDFADGIHPVANDTAWRRPRI